MYLLRGFYREILLKVMIPWYTGAISNPSDLKDYFFTSFHTHQFSVIEVDSSSLQIFLS